MFVLKSNKTTLFSSFVKSQASAASKTFSDGPKPAADVGLLDSVELPKVDTVELRLWLKFARVDFSNECFHM